jgi:hypothetical protein
LPKRGSARGGEPAVVLCRCGEEKNQGVDAERQARRPGQTSLGAIARVKAKALDAFRRAVEARYHNANRSMKDPDLKILPEDPEFKRLAERKNAVANGPTRLLDRPIGSMVRWIVNAVRARAGDVRCRV